MKIALQGENKLTAHAYIKCCISYTGFNPVTDLEGGTEIFTVSGDYAIKT